MVISIKISMLGVISGTRGHYMLFLLMFMSKGCLQQIAKFNLLLCILLSAIINFNFSGNISHTSSLILATFNVLEMISS